MVLMSLDTPALIRDLLSDIGRVTSELDEEVDFEIIGSAAMAAGQRKTLGDLLSSLTYSKKGGRTGGSRLYDQMAAMQGKYDLCFVIVEGSLEPTPEGKLKTYSFKSDWRYSSIMGLLFALFLHGVGIFQTPNEYGTAFLLRTMHNQLTGTSRFSYRQPKLRSFFKIREPMRLLCSFKGINVELADRIWKHHRQLSNFFLDLIATDGKSTLQIPDVGKAKVETFLQVLTEPYEG